MALVHKKNGYGKFLEQSRHNRSRDVAPLQSEKKIHRRRAQNMKSQCFSGTTREDRTSQWPLQQVIQEKMQI